MSVDQLKTALAKRRQTQTHQSAKSNKGDSGVGPRSQVSTKKPAKRSAARGR